MSDRNPTSVENAKGESAVTPDPEETPTTLVNVDAATADAPAAESPAPEADVETTFVVPEGLPFWCTAVNLPQEDGATLVIGRDGAHVPSADLEALTDQAARAGVVLTTPEGD